MSAYDVSSIRPALSLFSEGDRLWEEHRYFWNTQAQGFWVLTRYDTNSRGIPEARAVLERLVHANGPGPDLPYDPDAEHAPRHVKFRQLLNPQFSPQAVAKLVPMARQYCIDTINQFIDKGHCDLAQDFGGAYPTKVFLSWAGLPRWCGCRPTLPIEIRALLRKQTRSFLTVSPTATSPSGQNRTGARGHTLPGYR